MAEVVISPTEFEVPQGSEVTASVKMFGPEFRQIIFVLRGSSPGQPSVELDRLVLPISGMSGDEPIEETVSYSYTLPTDTYYLSAELEVFGIQDQSDEEWQISLNSWILVSDKPKPEVVFPTSEYQVLKVGDPWELRLEASNGPVGWDFQNVPEWMTADFQNGLLSGTPPEEGFWDVTVFIFNGNPEIGNFWLSLQATIEGPTQPPVITTTSLPIVNMGEVLEVYLEAESTEDVYWEPVDMPPWLHVEQDGFLIAFPDQAGSWEVTVRATNSAGFDEATFVITVRDPANPNIEPPVIVTESLPNADPEKPYSVQIQATGTAPITFEMFYQPEWLSISANGTISGVFPKGTYGTSIEVDATNEAGSTYKYFDILVNQPTPDPDPEPTPEPEPRKPIVIIERKVDGELLPSLKHGTIQINSDVLGLATTTSSVLGKNGEAQITGSVLEEKLFSITFTSTDTTGEEQRMIRRFFNRGEYYVITSELYGLNELWATVDDMGMDEKYKNLNVSFLSRFGDLVNRESEVIFEQEVGPGGASDSWSGYHYNDTDSEQIIALTLEADELAVWQAGTEISLTDMPFIIAGQDNFGRWNRIQNRKSIMLESSLGSLMGEGYFKPSVTQFFTIPSGATVPLELGSIENPLLSATGWSVKLEAINIRRDN